MLNEYLRIDSYQLLLRGISAEWLMNQKDCEWRSDYQCWFILKNSATHTLVALKYGDIFA